MEGGVTGSTSGMAASLDAMLALSVRIEKRVYRRRGLGKS